MGKEVFIFLCFSPFTTVDNVKSSFTKRQVMFPVFLALCFISKMLRLLFFIFYVIHIVNFGQLDLSSKNLYSFQ